MNPQWEWTIVSLCRGSDPDRAPRSPVPYTRDLMICGLGIMASGNQKLINSLGRILQTLAKNQSRLGHIPGLVHDPDDRGSSDTTPLFLLILGIYRKFSGEPDFLEEARLKAMNWMEYQSPSDNVIVDRARMSRSSISWRTVTQSPTKLFSLCLPGGSRLAPPLCQV